MRSIPCTHKVPAATALLGSVLLSCIPARPPARPPAASAPLPAPIPIPGPGEWSTWSHEKKLAYMKSPTFLLPEKALFMDYAPARYADFTCRTCHGKGEDDGTYRMPNPDLPQIVGGREYYQELAAKDPKALRFMQKILVPETARLLGLPAFDMASHTGFSCYQCHVHVTK